MSREQVPRAARMRPAAIAAGRRRCAGSKCDDGSEGGMSRKQGPREAGMRSAAIAASRRQRVFLNWHTRSEAVV